MAVSVVDKEARAMILAAIPQEREEAIVWLTLRLANVASTRQTRIRNKHQWRLVDPDSLFVAMDRGIDNEVADLITVDYVRYPRAKGALEAFLVKFVRGLLNEDGEPVRSLNDWRMAHEGSYAKALANGLHRKVCEELNLSTRRGGRRASPRKSEDQNPA